MDGMIGNGNGVRPMVWKIFKKILFLFSGSKEIEFGTVDIISKTKLKFYVNPMYQVN